MSLLKFFSITLLLCLFAALAVPAGLLFSAIEDAPSVANAPASASQEDLARIKRWLKSHNPNALRNDQLAVMNIGQRDLNLGVRAILPRPERHNTNIEIGMGHIVVNATLKLPANPLGSYVNLALTMKAEGGDVTPDAISFGELTLPGWTLEPMVQLGHYYLKEKLPEYSSVLHALQTVEFRPQKIFLAYRWDRELVRKLEERGRETMVPPADRERALAYYQALSRVSHRSGSNVRLDILLEEMFSTALTRSNEDTAAAENRVLLLVLGTVLNRTSILRVIGGDAEGLGRRHHYVKWTLHQRNDLALHFGVSAAIAATGADVLADALGVFKELDDSRGGTGFSFIDILADRAGVNFARAATGTSARRVQQFMASGSLSESDFMPSVADLPEGLMELEFKQRYRDLDDVLYAKVKNDVEARIAALNLYHQMKISL